MNYTVSDFFKTYKNSVKIISGAGGMSRVITSAGILDYEMESVLKDKYIHTNFNENQLVVSTFLYAKDNPFTILDAVKHLSSKGVSALVIKNVFKLPIHESVIRYANSKNFPIFIIEEQNIYVENIIYEVSRHCELLRDYRFAKQKISQIIHGELTESEIISCAKQLLPSCNDQFFAMCIKFDDQLSNAAFDLYNKRFEESDFNSPENALLLSDSRIFYIHSQDNIAKVYEDRFFRHILGTLLQGDSYTGCGISQYHLTLSEYKMCIQESLYAADTTEVSRSPFTKYSDLGVCRIIYPFFAGREMQRYAKEILSPIEDYDIENNSTLFETLQAYLKYDCDLTAAAGFLGQHKNTVRYRLDKIHELTGLDYKRFSQLEQLSVATKIRQSSMY